MNSVITAGFRERLGRLPHSVRDQASRAYALWRGDAHHPSLQFKKIHDREPVYSVRVALAYRAVGVLKDNEITWFWIGSHADYDRLLKSL